MAEKDDWLWKVMNFLLRFGVTAAGFACIQLAIFCSRNPRQVSACFATQYLQNNVMHGRTKANGCLAFALFLLPYPQFAVLPLHVTARRFGLFIGFCLARGDSNRQMTRRTSDLPGVTGFSTYAPYYTEWFK